MNEMDQLIRFRDAVPLEVTPHAEHLFRAGLREERSTVPRRGNRLTRIWPPWRLGVAASVAAALAAGLVLAVLPAAPVVLTAKLLADRASTAALAQPAVSPGQWVYRVVEWIRPHPPKGVPGRGTDVGWETADGRVTYGNDASTGVGTGGYLPSYADLGSLPRDPAALNAYLARLAYPHSNPALDIKVLAAFYAIDEMLGNYVLPPRMEAEVYQALAAIPGIGVDPHVTTIDGRSGVAFVLPPTAQSEKLEIILDASTYRFLADASWGTASWFTESAVLRTVIVGAPGSTRPSLTPPTAAQLLAEQADRAFTFTRTRPLLVTAGTWILRELATSSGDHTVWATADDAKQASYVNGKLKVCSRSAACAGSTRWLMPAGPKYTLINPRSPGRPPALPDTLPGLLAVLNGYHTGCADVAGNCNAVNAMANMLAGYANRGGPWGNWFLMLAGIPGVRIARVTDVTGQADLALRYPFTDGVTQILFSARTHRFVGLVRDGDQTVITREVTVTGPGSRTPVHIRPKSAPFRTAHQARH